MLNILVDGSAVITAPSNDEINNVVVSVHFPVDNNEVSIAGSNDQRGIILILGIGCILLVVVICTCIAFLVRRKRMSMLGKCTMKNEYPVMKKSRFMLIWLIILITD